MEAYTSFAAVYDQFMDNVPYTEWAGYLYGLLRGYGIKDGLLLELGCGTGTMTERLAQYGYDMIGVDCSEEMLEIAMEKRGRSGQDILYLLQDMREFELYGTVRAVVSVCDSMNYILEEKELEQVFRLVNNYLDPGGIFIFDFNTEYKYREILGNRTIAEDREDCSFIWDNYYYEEERINEYELTLFIRAGQDYERQNDRGGYREADLFRRYRETHIQKGYTLKKMKRALKNAGMDYLCAYDADTRETPCDKSERIYVVARERGKKLEIRQEDEDERLYSKSYGGRFTDPCVRGSNDQSDRGGTDAPSDESGRNSSAGKTAYRRCDDGKYDEKSKGHTNLAGKM